MNTSIDIDIRRGDELIKIRGIHYDVMDIDKFIKSLIKDLEIFSNNYINEENRDIENKIFDKDTNFIKL